MSTGLSANSVQIIEDDNLAGMSSKMKRVMRPPSGKIIAKAEALG